MRANIRKFQFVLGASMVATAVSAYSQTAAQPIFESQNCDPCVPAAVRQKAMAAAPLAAQSLPEAVTQRLKARFDLADVNRAGALTRSQAEAGGFGFIAQNFDAIDRRKAGAVTFDDVKSFLVARGAKLD